MREGYCGVPIELRQQKSQTKSKIASCQEGCQIGALLSRAVDRTLGITKAARLSLPWQNALFVDFGASDCSSGLPGGLVPDSILGHPVGSLNPSDVGDRQSINVESVMVESWFCHLDPLD